jgi:hypothetical protein
VPDLDALIKECPEREFASPYRSTVPLLSLLKHGSDMWTAILRELGMSDQADLHVEFTVSSPKGRGKASHTDLMLREAERAQAIEAKWGEPRYETVAELLERGGGSGNRREVLSGWLELLRDHASLSLRPEDVSEVVYQLIHRAASACSAGKSPGLAYLSFSPPPPGCGPDDHLKADLAKLLRSIHSRPSLFARVLEVQLEPTTEFLQLSSLPKGSSDTGRQVRAALLDGPLFKFLGHRVELVALSAA